MLRFAFSFFRAVFYIMIGAVIVLASGQYDANHPKLARAIGVTACGRIYAIMTVDSNGKIVAVTPSSPNAQEVAKEALSAPKDKLLEVPLEVGCVGAPDTQS